MEQSESIWSNRLKVFSGVLKTRLGRSYEVIVFGVLSSAFIFSFSSRTDILSGDSQLSATISNYQLEKFGKSLSLRSDYLFGLGGLQGGYLFWLDPVSLVGSLGASVYNHILVAFVFSMAIFALTRSLFTSLGQTFIISRFAAGLTAAATIWGYSVALVDNELFGHVPQYGSLLVVALALLCCFVQFGKIDTLTSFLWGLGFVLLVLHLFIALPHLIVTALPILIVVGTAVVIVAFRERRYKSLLKQFILITSTFVLLVLLKAPVFLNGFYKNTSAAEMPLTPYVQPQLTPFHRFVFESYFPTPSASGNYLFQFLAFGFLAAYLLGGLIRKTKRDGLWIASLFASIFLIVYRIWQSTWEFESGPRHSYFIWMMSPLYAMGFTQSGRSLYSRVRSIESLQRVRKNLSLRAVLLLLILLIGVSPLTSIRFSRGEPDTPPLKTLREPSFLADQISILKESEFRGRAAYLFQQPSYPANIANQIPLLNDYSHNLTPRSFALQSEFLLDADSSQFRNRFVYGLSGLKIYQMLGVKYLLVPKDKIDLLSALDVEEAKILQDVDEKNIVVELRDANFGSYSPTRVQVLPSLSKTFDALRDVKFNPKSDVISSTPLSGDFVSAKNTKLEIVDGDLHVTASATGKSIVLIPLEFSDCLEVKSISRSESPIELFLANGLITGLAFDKELDVVIQLRFGLFSNAACRNSDLEKFQEAFKN